MQIFRDVLRAKLTWRLQVFNSGFVSAVVHYSQKKHFSKLEKLFQGGEYCNTFRVFIVGYSKWISHGRSQHSAKTVANVQLKIRNKSIRDEKSADDLCFCHKAPGLRLVLRFRR